MLTVSVEKNLRFRAEFCHFPPLSLPFYPLFIPKDICFGLQKTVFCTPKDGLSQPKSLAFASETYIFRKTEIAHSTLNKTPSPLT